MAKNKQNFAERYTDEITVKVKGGTRTADLIERLEKDELFSKVTTPEDIKKAVKFYVAQTIQSMEDDNRLYTIKPEDIDCSTLSEVKDFKDGLSTAKQFVNALVKELTLRKHMSNPFMGMGMPGAMGGMGMNPTMGMGSMTPNNNLFGAGALAKMMSGESPDTLDKLMIMKTMSEQIEKDTIGTELECAHNITNTIYDSISKISLSKKSDISAKNKEEKK